jgi:hypothetical protein
MSLVIRDNAILATFPHWLVRLTFADLCLRFSLSAAAHKHLIPNDIA